jgi:hypothetical protein
MLIGGTEKTIPLIIQNNPTIPIKTLSININQHQSTIVIQFGAFSMRSSVMVSLELLRASWETTWKTSMAFPGRIMENPRKKLGKTSSQLPPKKKTKNLEIPEVKHGVSKPPFGGNL